MTKLSDISRKSFKSSEFSASSRSSSNTFKGDRFIPFRGTHDNFMEEFIINNELFKESKNKHKNIQTTNSNVDNQSTNTNS